MIQYIQPVLSPAGIYNPCVEFEWQVNQDKMELSVSGNPGIKGEILVIAPLQPDDSPRLSEMLQRQPQDYIKFFCPFPFDEKSITNILQTSINDLYYGIILTQQIVGLFMLRGWDDGYEIPSYGVVIDQEYSGLGIGQLTLETAKVICKIRGASRLMLKVHPENYAAKHIYEKFGFVQTGIDIHNNNIIYHYDL